MNVKKAFALIAANTLNSKKWKPTTLSRGAKAEQLLLTTAKCFAVIATERKETNTKPLPHFIFSPNNNNKNPHGFFYKSHADSFLKLIRL